MSTPSIKQPIKGIYLLPNVFTLSALFAGFYAIVTAMKGHFDNAAIAIYVAMLMDSLDGRVARLTHTQTAFGAELDSLSDMVSFGIAPALVMYCWSLNTLGKPGWLAAFVYAMAAALRLARFNTQLGTMDKRYFRGLATTPAAGILAGLVWVGHDYPPVGHWGSFFIGLLVVVAGLLMVSNIRYRSFKDLDLKDRIPFVALLTIAWVIILIALDPPRVLFLTFLVYGISGPIMTLWRYYQLRRRKLKSRA